MGRGSENTFDASVPSRHALLREAVRDVISRSSGLAAAAARPQVAAWVAAELLESRAEPGVMHDAAELLREISSGVQLTSAGLDEAVALSAGLENERVRRLEEMDSSERFALRGSCLALQAATLPIGKEVTRRRAASRALRLCLYSAAFSDPQSVAALFDRIEAGLVIASLGGDTPTLKDESEPPQVASDWDEWEVEVEMTLEDADVDEAYSLIEELAQLRQRETAEIISLTASAALLSGVFVAKEDWCQEIEALLARSATGAPQLDDEEIRRYLMAIADGELTIEAYQEIKFERLPGETDEQFWVRTRPEELVQQRAIRAAQSLVNAARAVVLSRGGQKPPEAISGRAEQALRCAAEAFAYDGRPEEFEEFLARLAA